MENIDLEEEGRNQGGGSYEKDRRRGKRGREGGREGLLDRLV